MGEGGLGNSEGQGQLVANGVFHFVASYVLNCVKNASDKSFATLRKSILRGLCEAALACGCAWKLNRARGDVTWFLDGHRLTPSKLRTAIATQSRRYQTSRRLENSTIPL